MPNRIMIEVGAETIEVPIKGTAVQIRARLRRLVIQRGRDIAGLTPAQIGRLALYFMMKWGTDQSMDRHRAEKLSETSAAIEAEISADNDAVDEPTP